MFKEMKVKTEGPVGKITLACTEIRGSCYGAAPCVVTIGGASLDSPDDPTFAVMEGRHKWVSTRSDCITWLRSHGLAGAEPELLLEYTVLADKLRDKVPSLTEQTRRGHFDEEVEKLVDSMIAAVRAGEVKYTLSAITTFLKERIEQSSYLSTPVLIEDAIEFSGERVAMAKVSLVDACGRCLTALQEKAKA